MTVQAEPELGPLIHKETSTTAASAHDRKFPDGGVQTYRVNVVAGGLLMPVDVEAATGDEAALKALERYQGGKVAYVGPASGPDMAA